jgi:diguanylate cyclase (GGDEF)-like protein
MKDRREQAGETKGRTEPPGESGTYEPTSRPRVRNDDARARWLRRILEERLVSVVFQPVVNLLTGDAFLYEVLGRMPAGLEGAPDYVQLGPVECLDVAERDGLLLELDRAWQQEAVAVVARDHRAGNLTFSLNVDPRILDDPAFRPGHTRDLVERAGLSPNRFVLEITEAGPHVSGQRLQEIVRHCTAEGFRIALDDFGSGYASLSALLALSPHLLKVDKYLVTGLAMDPVRANLLRALTDFARRSGIQLVAEGIETEADLVAVLRAGVMLGQGYLLATPQDEARPVRAEIRSRLRAIAADVERTRFHSISTRQVSEVMQEHPVVQETLLGKEVERRFRTEPLRAGFPVVDAQGGVTGLIMRDRFFSLLSGPYGYALYGSRPVREIMDQQPLCANVGATIESVSRLATARPETNRYDLIIVENELRYVGVVMVYGLLATTTEMEIEHAAYASPLTGLPGNVVIEHEIKLALDAAADRASTWFVYADLDNFKAYNDVYGFAAGDEVIRLVARILDECFSAPAFERSFLGHVGGDDFIVVVQEAASVEDACARVASRFDAEVEALYAPADLERGHIVATDRRGDTVSYPITGLSLAIVSSADIPTPDVREVGRVAAELKKRAKGEALRRGWGSGWVRERRQPQKRE